MFCFHKYDIVGVTKRNIFKQSNDMLPVKILTDISLVCKKCGMPKLKTVKGSFEIGE
jgi:hypothetical protein